MVETLSNSELASRINQYWAAKGLIAGARVETRTSTIAPRIRVKGAHKLYAPGYTATLEIIVSDMVNGVPTKPVARVQVAA